MLVGTLGRSRKRRWDTLTPRGQTVRQSAGVSRGRESDCWEIHNTRDANVSDKRGKGMMAKRRETDV